MDAEVYMGYRILLYLATTCLAWRWSLRCVRTSGRAAALTAGVILILMNEVIAAFLAPVFAVLATALSIVFAIGLVVVLLTGHSLGSVFQHFNIFRKK